MKRFLPLLLAALAGCATSQAPSRPGAPGVSAHEPPQAMAAPSAPTGETTEPMTGGATPSPAPAAPAKEPLSSRQAFADWNDSKLLDIYKDMTKEQVEKIMTPDQAGKWRNPYKRQVLRASNGKAYEVLFYFTRVPSKGRPITENQMTPVIFNEGKVVAMGRYQLKKLRRSLAL